MSERRSSGILGKFFGKEHEDSSEYKEMASPPAAVADVDGQQKRKSFRLSFRRAPGALMNGAASSEDAASQYRGFEAKPSVSGEAHHDDSSGKKSNDHQLVVYPTTQDKRDELQQELSIPQTIKLKASRWLDRLLAPPQSSPPSQSASFHISEHHVKASRYIDQATHQPLHAAEASIAAENKALVLAPQMSSEGLWRERGRLAGLKAQRDGWLQKKHNLIDQLRVAEERKLLLKEKVQQLAVHETRTPQSQQGRQQQYCDGVKSELVAVEQKGEVENEEGDCEEGLTSHIHSKYIVGDQGANEAHEERNLSHELYTLDYDKQEAHDGNYQDRVEGQAHNDTEQTIDNPTHAYDLAERRTSTSTKSSSSEDNYYMAAPDGLEPPEGFDEHTDSEIDLNKTTEDGVLEQMPTSIESSGGPDSMQSR